MAKSGYYLSPEQMNRMTRSELAKFVNRAASTANKRIKRIEDKGLTEQSLIYQELRDARIKVKFSTAAKDKMALVNELRFINKFLEDETSTITGIENERIAAETRSGPMTLEQQITRWKAAAKFRKFNEALYQRYGSERVFNLLDTMIQNNISKNADTLAKRIEQIIDQTVERNQLNFRGSEDRGFWLP